MDDQQFVTTLTGAVSAWGMADREGIDMEQPTVQRLTLECGHLRISGPYDSPLNDDGTPRHMIGDITWCELCPRVPTPSGLRREMALRQVVNVEGVPFDQFREPLDAVSRACMEQVHG